VKTQAVVAAQIEFSDGHPPRSIQFDDIYHPQAGAIGQANHVFLAGNGLPERWRAQRQFVIVETGFGLGNNFLATWQAWKQDPQRCERLVFVSVEKHPPRREDLERAHAQGVRDGLLVDDANAPTSACACADALVREWPPLTPGIHTLEFEAGAVQLMLAIGDAQRVLPALQLQADAFYLDGFSPARNPQMWSKRVVNALARIAAPQATAATWSVARELRAYLQGAGFETSIAPGFDRKREMTRARFAPAFTPRTSPGRTSAAAAESQDGEIGAPRTAIIVGAGLAGASAASALARLGWQCAVLESQVRGAQGASGNPAGLFHGTVHAVDGTHARFTRAAALHAARCYGALIDAGHVRGAVGGLLRVRADTLAQPMPAEYVRVARDSELPSWASTRFGGCTALLYPGGGWIAPADLVDYWLSRPGVAFRGDHLVHALERSGARWQAVGDRGQVLAEAPVLVLACGASALPRCAEAARMALQPQRGQVTWFESPHKLDLPLSGHGYALSLPDGRVLCGATASMNDDDPQLRDDDHAQNLERLSALAGLRPTPGQALHGRVGWRALARDRLPIVGAMPLTPGEIEPGARLDHARMVPRVPGLFMLGGLASRGLTWAPLAGQVLAAWIAGAPVPLESDLLDAIDPARWLVRATRARSRNAIS
jgi:tRNA 5-methylaminomethyl-2-thiouridine biosynthesis bifunctional protein